MRKNVLWILLPGLIIISCNLQKAVTPEEQQGVLDNLKVEAANAYNELHEKTGNDYLAQRDRYYALKHKWIKTAEGFTKTFTYDNRTEDEIRRMSYIADIAKKEQLVADIIKIDFNRFPESVTVFDLVQRYFSNAYLIEPQEIEKYVNFKMFPKGEELYCYAMLSLGFSGLGNILKANEYFGKMNNLLAELIEDPNLRRTIPLLHIVSIRSLVAWRLGEPDLAYKYIEDAKKEFTRESEQLLLELYTNRLKVLGNRALSLGTQHWIGTKKPLNISTIKGKVILLDFFTWNCETCIINLPFLKRINNQIHNKDFMIIGVTEYLGRYENVENLSEEQEYNYMKNHFYKKRKISWPVSMSKISRYDYGINIAPTYILIDKAGVVRDGYFISNYTYLKNKIELLLKEDY